jgi:hypothetical protein
LQFQGTTNLNLLQQAPPVVFQQQQQQQQQPQQQQGTSTLLRMQFQQQQKQFEQQQLQLRQQRVKTQQLMGSSGSLSGNVKFERSEPSSAVKFNSHCHWSADIRWQYDSRNLIFNFKVYFKLTIGSITDHNEDMHSYLTMHFPIFRSHSM